MHQDKASPSLDQQINHRDSVALVYTLMNSLPEQQQLIVQLRDVEQYDFETIAAIAEMSEGAVRVAL